MTAKPPEDEIIETLAELRYSPRDFVYWAYPWGERNTDLSGDKGPEPWQDQLLSYLQERMQDYRHGVYMPTRIHVVSGHGVGKSALVAWLNQWAFSTLEETKGVLTAGTETQLKTKTWVEMAKWLRLSLIKPLFKLTATAMFPIQPHKVAGEEWRLDIVPWSEHNPEAFAGLHNLGKRVIVCLDEASGIAEIIHETAAGVDTDKNTEIIRLQTGNPTKAEGYFYDSAKGELYGSQWEHFHVDSRSVSIANIDVIEEEIAIHGEDSDYIRVRRLGLFPAQNSESFIPRALVERAQARTLESEACGPLIMGLDIGRKNDHCVASFRRGLDAASIPQVKFKPNETDATPPTLQVVNWLLRLILMYDPDELCLDMGYIGAAIYDILLNKRLARPIIYPVDFGSKPLGYDEQDSSMRYVNRRAQIFGRSKVWLTRGSLEDNKELKDELISFTYELQGETKILLESKKQIRKRLDRSTDRADAFALTFAEGGDIVLPVGEIKGLHIVQDWEPPAADDPFSMEAIYGTREMLH